MGSCLYYSLSSVFYTVCYKVHTPHATPRGSSSSPLRLGYDVRCYTKIKVLVVLFIHPSRKMRYESNTGGACVRYAVQYVDYSLYSTRVEVLAYPTRRFLNCTERVSPAAITLTRPRLCKLAASSRVGLST